MKRQIRNYNNKGQWYGYQELYINDTLYFRGKYKNGYLINYAECSISTVYYIR